MEDSEDLEEEASAEEEVDFKMPECSSVCGCIPTEKTMKEEKIIKCPKCHVNMLKLTNGKYVIDKCPKCEGIFLDKNEVDVAHKIGFVTYVMDYFRKDKHKK